ncbi:fibronectin type III domain-containing protein [Paenibacillus medicaginis]|uniref:Fibronectin type III domain-containing protein n=1 Tax=Paenibacillus medicaginis TaxID=1470560 RepID=A0ABV5C5F3_9BACL
MSYLFGIGEKIINKPAKLLVLVSLLYFVVGNFTSKTTVNAAEFSDTLTDGSKVYAVANVGGVSLIRNNVSIHYFPIDGLSIEIHSISVSGNNSISVRASYIDEVSGKRRIGTNLYYDDIVLTTPAPPVITPNINSPTNQDIRITLSGYSSGSTVQYKIEANGQWNKYSNPFVVINNSTIYARIFDKYGNQSGESTYVISNIDKTPPGSPVISYAPREITNSVNVSIAYSSDSVIKQFRLNRGEWLTYNSGIQVTDNGTVIEARAMDSAGNISSSQEIVINNLNRPPVAIKHIPNIALEVDEGIQSINLSEYFMDPENQVLNYVVDIKNSGYVTVTINNNVMKLQPIKAGSEPIKVNLNIKDTLGKSISQEFNITVKDSKYAELLNRATLAVIEAEQNKRQQDIDNAWPLVNLLREPEKSEFSKRLVAVQTSLDNDIAYAKQVAAATEAVIKAENSHELSDIKSARVLVAGLKEVDQKPLLDRLNNIQIIDTTSPSKPLALTASNITSTSVLLSWEASTDDVGVVGYDVYGNDQLIGVTSDLTFEVNNLGPQTNYVFYVKAKDQAGNYSAASNSIRKGVSRSYSYYYDAYGRLDYVELEGIKILDYEYDKNGNLIKIIKPTNP